MSLRYLHHAEIDLAAWDTCVTVAQASVPYAYSWWLTVTVGKWDAVVELNDATGAYNSILPLPAKWRPWGRQVYQPAFTQQLGLLTTAESQQQNLTEYLALVAGRYSRFYTQANVSNNIWQLPAGFASTERRTYLLDLAPNYATLLAGYAADYKRRLRRNQQQIQPLVVKEGETGTALVELFRLYKGGEVAELKAWHYRQLAALINALQARGLASIVEVRQPGTDNLLASALFVKHRGGLIYLFAAASPAGKQAGAPLLLLDHTIQQYAGTPGFVLDFEGGMIPSIARFFANFGATPAPYAAVALSTPQPWYMLWKP
ncbi:GNAT family N-acetyltransferase [Hymenobacter sp. GOD-10R]|uniref:GNAT family N-acetyltransferase n=1 Tax=Hymenobacter sp. GOD-10R TaxID=3093922 RepID=UPI002D769116|nr:GNAT family N-acetyltransferase [Hymenobacter sp. GOD-10R]WRQ28093.1 GNAT family N-acetyltransferase [Hymenobacter sp. GOD-10R]